MPVHQQLYDLYRHEGFVFLAVIPVAGDQYIADFELTHPVIDDPGAELAAQAYAPPASPYIPAMTVLNRRMEVVAWHWTQLSEEFLVELLDEPPPETDYVPVNFIPE